jgi:hypothetical protein
MIPRQAEPKELIQSRYQQFQRRWARHLNDLSEQAAAPEPEVMSRQPLQVRAQSVQQQVRQKPVAENAKQTPFAVYQQNEEERQRTIDSAAFGGVSGWSALPTERQQAKENTGQC